MMILSLLRTLGMVSLFLWGAVAVAEEKLQSKDVQKIMDQILTQHSADHAMTDKILQSALINYMNQFDPTKAYLLESEYEQYSHLDSNTLNQFKSEYQKQNYQAFEKLNEMIQKAIKRTRSYREELFKEEGSLFLESAQKQNLNSEIEEQLKSFAQNIEELKKRIKNELLLFIREERGNYGEKAVMNNQKRMLLIYDQFLKHRENQYLYYNEEGRSLPADEANNLFYMHLLKALSSSLDSHTAFLNDEEAYDLKVILEKGFKGIGVILQNRPDGVVVGRLVEGGPAEKSGLVKIGDQVVSIDGENVEGQTAQELVEKLHETKNEGVQLLLRRSNLDGEDFSAKTIPVTLNRQFIEVNEGRVDVEKIPVSNGIIGVLALHAFYQGENGVTSEKDLRDAIEKLRSEGNLKGIILDLRDNGGGFLSQAVKVAGLFITNGVVVVSKYSNGEKHFFRDMDGKTTFNGPLIILVSKETASAAEIVAQALQDYGVGLIVGDERTYGKGTIQSQTITDGSSSAHFKVTVGRYYTVSGKTPQLQGVKADIVVPGPYNNEHIGEEYLQNHLSADSIEPSYDDPLEDVKPALKPWLLQYYMPTLQKKDTHWKRWIPVLKTASAKRVANNSDYQKFLKKQSGNGGAVFDSRKTESDLQLEETIRIMKDMIELDKK